MFDAAVQQLLEQTIDTPFKLNLLLIFHDNAWLDVTATQIAERMCRDIWSTRTALDDLARGGVLATRPGIGEAHYTYGPRPDLVVAIKKIVAACEHPLERDVVQLRVRELASYAASRHATPWEMAVA